MSYEYCRRLLQKLLSSMSISRDTRRLWRHSSPRSTWRNQFYYRPQRRLCFLSFCPRGWGVWGGIPACIVGGIPACLAAGEMCYPSMHSRWNPSMPCSREVCYPSMHCRWYLNMPYSGGVPAPVGSALGVACSQEGGACSRGCLLLGCLVPGGREGLLRGVPALEGCLETFPESRRLLFWIVRILLECNLV